VLLSFKGRAGRREFWVIVGPILVWNVALISALEAVAPHGIKNILAALLVLIFGMMAPDFLGVTAISRRLHDLNRSAWWIYGLGIVARLAQSTYKGSSDVVARTGVLILAVLLAGAAIGYLGLRKGDPGKNQFGPAPSAKASKTATS